MAVTESDVRSGDTGIAVRNPRTGKVLYTIDLPSDQEVVETYRRAREAFKKLKTMSVRERLGEIAKLKRYILEHREEVAEKIVSETGKCITDALMLEIFPALDTIEYYEKNAERILADERVKTPIFLFGKKSKVVYEPLGPVFVISPWNYPFHLSFIPVVCAFVAGNAVILKPSSYTPLKGLYEEITEKSGFMKDAIQVVYATRKHAQKLIEEKPAKIFFTGSVGAGKKVMASAAEYAIPVELELGGKDPMVVFDDVNIDRTVNGALWGGFVNSGQTCTSVERIYVQEGIYDRFVTALTEKIGKLRIVSADGSGEDNGEVDMGCMTPEFQIEGVESQIADAKAKGATIVCGGQREDQSHVFPPTVVTNLDKSMKIIADETFGPVVTVESFKTEQEAIELANASPFGLSASVWSADLVRAERVARSIVTGNVSINNVLATHANAGLPFGGVKDSGFGRYRGPWGLHTFSNIKSMVVDKQGPRIELNWYPYSKRKLELFHELMEAAFSGKPLSLLRTALVGLKLELLTRKNRL
ncbi:MAG: aldehyde dehydrogenase family protein [Candidatus Hydrogenedentes bacterium]|nr:aldehyde dehydrogenase family protein [Candidatus Hydrogenedentota bacterium]